MAELIIPPVCARRITRLCALPDDGRGSILGKRLELQAIRADGTEFPIELAITAINTGSARCSRASFATSPLERRRKQGSFG